MVKMLKNVNFERFNISPIFKLSLFVHIHIVMKKLVSELEMSDKKNKKRNQMQIFSLFNSIC